MTACEIYIIRLPRHGSTAPKTPDLAALANIGMLAIGTGRADARFVMEVKLDDLPGSSR